MAWTTFTDGPPAVTAEKLNGNFALTARKDTPNNFLTYNGLVAVAPGSVPTPPAGTRYLYVSSVDGKTYVKTSAATSISLEEQGGGGGGAVDSFNGRTGAVVAEEGDYALDALSDVTIASPSNGQVLRYNGAAWVNGSATGISATKYTFDFTDVQTGSVGNVLAVATLGQFEKVCGITIKHSVKFAGGTFIEVSVELRWDFSGNQLAPPFSIFQPVTDDAFTDIAAFSSGRMGATATPDRVMSAIFTGFYSSGSPTLNDLTQGSVDIWLATFTLPS